MIPMFVMIAFAREPDDIDAHAALREHVACLFEKDGWAFSLIYVVTFGGFIGLTSFLPTYYYDQFGVSKVQAGQLELDPDLPDDLLTLADIRFGLVARQLLAGAADRESFLVQQAPDLPDDEHVLALVIAPIAPALDRLQLGKFLLPVPEHMRLDGAELADLADREIPLPRDRGQDVVISGFQHRLPLWP